MCLADNTNDDGTLLDSFLCVLDLEDAALWRAVLLVSETIPIASIWLSGRRSCSQCDGVVVVVVAKHDGRSIEEDVVYEECVACCVEEAGRSSKWMSEVVMID